MKLTIEPTEQFFMCGDVMVRLWQGVDDTGQPLVALVTAVVFTGQVPEAVAGLVSIPPPDADAARRWAEQIIGQADRA